MARILAGQSPESDAIIDFDGDGLPFMQGNAEFGIHHPVPIKRCDIAPRVAPSGSVLVSVRAPVGAVNVADRDYGIGRGLAAVVAQGIEAQYCRYLLMSEAEQLNSIATGSTFTAITGNDLGDLPIAVSDLATQRAIADFLDSETAQIDAFIAKSEQLITLLTERRSAELFHQLLEAPGRVRHPVRAVLTKLNRPATAGGEVVTAFRDGQVTSRANRRTDGFTETETDDRTGYQGVERGDLVYHGLDGFAGAVGVSDSSGICSPVYHVCATTALADEGFMALLLRALGTSGFLEAYAWSVRQRSVDYRNWSTFGALPIELPSVVDQRVAVAKFELAAAKIDA
ncbi:MAG TPA: restriction endonuclease subunit S, partial [Marmoricola sp.]|nr:restriction endonuclease subunit S [Marmoricola sp.]